MSFKFVLSLIEPSLWYDDTKTAQMNKELKTQVLLFVTFTPHKIFDISCLVLVQPRKTCPDITKRLLTGKLRIKSNKIF